MIKVFITLLTLAIASPALAIARENIANSTPPPVSATFSFDDASNYFLHAVTPTVDQLQGSWIQVGSAKAPGYPDPTTPDAYDLTGIKNEDGSIPTLEFSSVAGFDGNKLNIVSALNLGNEKADQGPYKFEIEPLGAAYSESLYMIGGTGSAHLENKCALLKNNASKMICQNNLRIDDPAGLSASFTSYDKHTVYYCAYIRK